MSKKEPEVTAICQSVFCSKNKLADRLFWRKEIDHQYQFYLATLRAERDARYIVQENSDLLRRIEKAETANVELRKEIRLLQMELFLMYQRNAHDSVVIDGLHEANHESGESKILESQMRRRIDIASVESNHEDGLAEILKKDLALLQRKDGEDAELILLMQPMENQLKKTLEVEKLRNHQQAMMFKRDLEETLKEFTEKISYLESIKSEKRPEMIWIVQIFSSIFDSKANLQTTSETDDTMLNKSSQETGSFDISIQEEISKREDLDEDFQRKKEEYNEFVSLKEFLDVKNKVNIQLIYNCLQGFTECVKELTGEYLSVFKTSADIRFIKEYLERLDAMRKKKDVVKSNQNPVQTAQRLDQLNLIYTTLLAEKTFIENMLNYFTATLKEDFEAHCVSLHEAEGFFLSSASNEKSGS